MADIRGQGVDFAAIGIQGEGVVLTVLDPEVAIEAPPEIGRLPFQCVGERFVPPDCAGETRRANLRVVGVALELACSAREAGQTAVAVGDRVPRILPALVLQAGFLVSAFVGDVAVALEVRVIVDPAQRSACLWFELSNQVRSPVQRSYSSSRTTYSGVASAEP